MKKLKKISASMAFSLPAGLYQCSGLHFYFIDFLVRLRVLGLRPTPVVTWEKVRDNMQEPYSLSAGAGIYALVCCYLPVPGQRR